MLLYVYQDEMVRFVLMENTMKIKLEECEKRTDIDYNLKGYDLIGVLNVETARSVLGTNDKIYVNDKLVTVTTLKSRVFKKKGIVCKCCGEKPTIAMVQSNITGSHSVNFFVEKEDGLSMMTIDHTIPKSLGGRDDLDNLEPMCAKCNLDKSAECSLQEMLEYHASHYPISKTKQSFFVDKLENHIYKRALVLARGCSFKQQQFVNQQKNELKKLVDSGWRLKRED